MAILCNTKPFYSCQPGFRLHMARFSSSYGTAPTCVPTPHSAFLTAVPWHTGRFLFTPVSICCTFPSPHTDNKGNQQGMAHNSSNQGMAHNSSNLLQPCALTIHLQWDGWFLGHLTTPPLNHSSGSNVVKPPHKVVLLQSSSDLDSSNWFNSWSNRSPFILCLHL